MEQAVSVVRVRIIQNLIGMVRNVSVAMLIIQQHRIGMVQIVRLVRMQHQHGTEQAVSVVTIIIKQHRIGMVQIVQYVRMLNCGIRNQINVFNV